MNAKRRKEITNCLESIADQLARLQELKDDERDYLDNVPENLQSSERYEKDDMLYYELEGAIESLENAVDELEEATKN
ncbi:hypothetical protein HB904_04445 [Listeria booriae]|uniref:ABC transporter Uup C-terminal domain-containing protein n=1 Tax=Listeria booriae TaxID=1552123 RepID=A0A842AC69_9LIST|nr:hypothetical protein [Listeria booriae]MBC1615423.1 hypothetical protein [Listeria booriae]